MDKETIKLEDQLKKHFGFSSFREGQKEIIESVLDNQHTLATLPTGSGKSICYQLPSLIVEGITIVVSPLISLMVDQVKLLRAQGYKRVTALNSLLSYEQKSKLLSHLNRYRMIYCSPEMLQQESFINRLKQLNVLQFVIDEAHCISQWGHEFRPDYLRLKDVIETLGEPTVLALSATATPKIQDDIVKQLSLNMRKIIYPMDRVNITYSVLKSDNQIEKQEQIIHLLEQAKAPTMIYFSSRVMTEQLYGLLQQQFPERKVAYYHGGMEQQDRLLIQQQFMHDQLDIICCTSAFGMGVNKDNIRLIIHYHLPTNLESFIQETGRAGRDGKQSVSVLLYTKGDETIPFQIIESELPDDSEIERYLHAKQEGINIDIESELSETKLRFLNYHTHKLTQTLTQQSEIEEELKSFRDHRKQLKINSVINLVRWVNAEDCRRALLFQPYQEHVRPALFDCCDHCGFNIHKWEIDLNIHHDYKQNWRNILEEMFQ
ncbi:RecQ family ATP-dependent DNA helicase [Tenuibacillus multivorans]|uniref:ATP-dependent DNA helicase RecQ n=1 Tax=Tenuibacillus multivorans TaxID=237069 RepID=A0A1H0CX16_9BACI|nr:ATP-dependent DNA helicase RecQ [Tenuibacillus multivorans]GEL76131.1 ATP-dependent DNA helicase [Tenuibacillus multivorans]SDN62442.1 ATP-dependent DNA helicase RecQ [Tenuibacillus multivorans]